MNIMQREYVKRLLKLKQNKLRLNKSRLMETNKSFRRVKTKSHELKEIDHELLLIKEIYDDIKPNVK